MAEKGALAAIFETGRLVFTTREIAALCSSSTSSVTQTLARIEKQGIVTKILRGVWGMTVDRKFSPCLVIPYLSQNHRSYLSFISALHLCGVIGQIPRAITVATTAHSKKIRTPVGTYWMHRISPGFFDGFDWNAGGDYLVASPEKALVDCLYLAGRKGKQYAHFPELDLEGLNRKKVMGWVARIEDARIRKSVATAARKIFV